MIPSTPPTRPSTAGDVDLLLTYLHERDCPCPRCGYNLRNLTQPRCPECEEDLALAVNVRRLRFGWLLLTLVPGAFSGIAAIFLLLPIVIVPLTGGGPAPWFIVATDAFGWLSGLATIFLAMRRYDFLRRSIATQKTIAMLVWFVHILAFVGLLAMIFG